MTRTWIEIKLTNGLDDPMPSETCVLYPKDAEPLERILDNDGCLREENLPAGPVAIEFPDFIEISRVVDGKETWGPSREARSSRGDYERESGASIDVGEFNYDASEDEAGYGWREYEEDDVDSDWDEVNENETDDGASLAQDLDIDDAFEVLATKVGDRPFVDISLVAADSATAEPSESYETAIYRGSTGNRYHFAVLMCIAVEVHSTRLVDEDEPLGFRLAEPDGRLLIEDEADDWFIFHDAVGLGDYDLTISGVTIEVPSVSRATEAVVYSIDEIFAGK